MTPPQGNSKQNRVATAWLLGGLIALVLAAAHPLLGILAGLLFVWGKLVLMRPPESSGAGPLFRIEEYKVSEIPFLYPSAKAWVRHLGLGRSCEILTGSKEQLDQRIQELQQEWEAEWEQQCRQRNGRAQKNLIPEAPENGWRLPPGDEPPHPQPPPAPLVRLDGWRYPSGYGGEASQVKPQLPPARNLPPLAGVMLARFWVAGTGFHLQAEECPLLEPGMPLELQAEPDNEHDSFAVAVLHQGLKLGYIPREDNKAISRLLQAGKPLACRLCNLAAEKAPWRMYEAEIYQLNHP